LFGDGFGVEDTMGGEQEWVELGREILKGQETQEGDG